MSRADYSPIEREAIVLAAVLDMIDAMVNRTIFGEPITYRPTNLLFETGTHRRMFAILLGDFLSLPQGRGKRPPPFGLTVPRADETGSAKTYLRYLRAIAEAPQLASDPSALKTAVEAFAIWLDGSLTYPKVWLSDLNIEFDMTVERIWMLKTVGDLSKHNFSRLEGQIARIRDMLQRHNHAVEEGLIYMALPNIEEWLSEDLLVYHSSTIAEFLNNIRLAIYAYLAPEFARAFRRCEDIHYTFHAPTGIGEGLPLGMYWRLMNALRLPPIFPPFEVSTSFKLRY